MLFDESPLRGRRSNSKKLRPKRASARTSYTNVGDPNKGASSSGRKK